MLSTGIVQLLKVKEEADIFARPGYPGYFMTMPGGWKLLGVIAMLISKFSLLKEWTYAGFFFAISGVVVSHLVIGYAAKELFGPILLIILTLVSLYLRPAIRKMNAGNIN